MQKITGAWCADGIAVFNYINRNNYRSGSHKCIWCDLYSRFCSRWKNSECDGSYFYFLWRSNGNLCWTELRSRKDGPRKARRAKHTDYGFDLEFCIDGIGIVVWEIRNLSVCGSNRNRCGRGGTYIFQSSRMVLSFSWQYFYLS